MVGCIIYRLRQNSFTSSAINPWTFFTASKFSLSSASSIYLYLHGFNNNNLFKHSLSFSSSISFLILIYIYIYIYVCVCVAEGTENKRILMNCVEVWWNTSSQAQDLRLDNQWSAGLCPTVFHQPGASACSSAVLAMCQKRPITLSKETYYSVRCISM